MSIGSILHATRQDRSKLSFEKKQQGPGIYSRPYYGCNDSILSQGNRKGSIGKKFNYYMIASAVGLALSAPSMAAELTDAEYAAAEQKIEAEYASAKTACASLSGNESEICIVEADSKNEVAKAELEAKNDPTAGTSGYGDMSASDTGETVTPTDSDSGETDTSMYGDTSTADTGDNDPSQTDSYSYGDSSTADTGDNDSSQTDSSSDSDSDETDALFDFDSAELRADGRETLDAFVQKSKENSVAQIKVTGHTDSLGDDAYNQYLSEERTKAVKEYLVSEGIAADRIRTEGKGDAQSTLSANECQGKTGDAVIACFQPDRRVVVSMNQTVGSN
ncbi:MAG: OmpA family protein [Woeseiaceae bacterium]|nr:OmpA family protein [Woeseiaceae bacterium]